MIPLHISVSACVQMHFFTSLLNAASSGLARVQTIRPLIKQQDQCKVTPHQRQNTPTVTFDLNSSIIRRSAMVGLLRVTVSQAIFSYVLCTDGDILLL